MWTVLIWSDVEDDFIEWKNHRQEVERYEDEYDAITAAFNIKKDTGEQTKVQYIRNVSKRKAKPKHSRASRIQRFHLVKFGNEFVKATVVNTKGQVLRP